MLSDMGVVEQGDTEEGPPPVASDTWSSCPVQQTYAGSRPTCKQLHIYLNMRHILLLFIY